MIHFLAGVLSALTCLFSVRLRSSPFTQTITRQQRRQLLIANAILSVIMVILMTLFMHLWHHTETIQLMRIGGILFSGISALIQMLVIRKWIREQLFVFFIVLSCSYVLMAVPSFVTNYFSQDMGCGYFFILVGTYFVVMLLVHIPMYRVLRDTVEPFLDIDTGDYWGTLWFIPLAIFGIRLLSTGKLDYTNDVPHLLENLLSFALILLVCHSISNDHKHLHDKHLLDQRVSQQQIHYAELKVRLNDARKLKHDFKHHIAVIRHYIDTDDKAGLDHYCDEFLASLDSQGQIPYSGNAAADGVIYHYMQRSAQDNITFRYAGMIHSPGIKDMDLCVLLGNALDNALAGCMTIASNRSISLISQSDPQLLSIAVHNTFDGHIAHADGNVLSRKRDNNQQGIGLDSMQAICQRYGGSMETSWDEHSFTIVFLLPLTPEE